MIEESFSFLSARSNFNETNDPAMQSMATITDWEIHTKPALSRD